MGIKLRQALAATATLIRDPLDYPAMMRMADALAEWAVFQRLYRRMIDGLSESERERLRVLTLAPIDLDALERLPERTFGHRYARFMKGLDLDPEPQARALPAMAKVLADDWVMRRFARGHDMHHVLTGFPVDGPAEIGLQVFNHVNFREPFGLLALLAVPRVIARYGQARRTLREVRRGFRLGARAGNLLTAPLEDWFADDLDDVQRRLGLLGTDGQPVA